MPAKIRIEHMQKMIFFLKSFKCSLNGISVGAISKSYEGIDVWSILLDH